MRPTATIKLFLLGLFIYTSGLSLRAAETGVGVTLLSYTLDTNTHNQINLGYTLTIYAQVTNFDTVPFNGFINFGLHNAEETLTSSGIFDKPPYSGDSISLGGGQTVPAIFSVGINTPYFRPGPDVVVVWPICSQPIADSILIHLTVLDPSGINGQNEIPLTYAVVNNTILLKSQDPRINFKQVRIYNTIGQKVSEINSNYISSIPLTDLTRGIYFCELTTADGRRATFKFVCPGN